MCRQCSLLKQISKVQKAIRQQKCKSGKIPMVTEHRDNISTYYNKHRKYSIHIDTPRRYIVILHILWKVEDHWYILKCYVFPVQGALIKKLVLFHHSCNNTVQIAALTLDFETNALVKVACFGTFKKVMYFFDNPYFWVLCTQW